MRTRTHEKSGEDDSRQPVSTAVTPNLLSIHAHVQKLSCALTLLPGAHLHILANHEIHRSQLHTWHTCGGYGGLSCRAQFSPVSKIVLLQHLPCCSPLLAAAWALGIEGSHGSGVCSRAACVRSVGKHGKCHTVLFVMYNSTCRPDKFQEG